MVADTLLSQTSRRPPASALGGQARATAHVAVDSAAPSHDHIRYWHGPDAGTALDEQNNPVYTPMPNSTDSNRNPPNGTDAIRRRHKAEPNP